MAAIYRRGKLCNCCHARENLWRLQYKRGKLCNCCHARQSLWCRTSAGNYATGAMRGKNCDGCKRGSTQLMLSAGIHANCRCKHTVCFRSGKRTLALTCSLRTVWTLEDVFWTFQAIFLSTSSNCDWSDLGNLYTVLILKSGIEDLTDRGLLKIRLTLTSLSFWFCLQRCLWFPVLFLTCLHFTKVWHRTYPIWNAPLSRWRGAASLRSRNRAKITVLVCEQKPYPVWFLCRRKSILWT